MSYPFPKPGFTLAELLIALALLGIIAAFTIPKVLQSSASQERVAKLRETVATLEDAWYNARATNTVVAGTLYDNINGRVNTVQAGSDPVANPGAPYETMFLHPCNDLGLTGYFVFANGVVISGVAFNNITITAAPPANSSNSILCIDLNGQGSPNEPGQDIFFGNFNQWGDFDWSVDTVYVVAPNQKSFFWGNETTDVFTWWGNPLFAPYDTPESRVGTWLTR